MDTAQGYHDVCGQIYPVRVSYYYSLLIVAIYIHNCTPTSGRGQPYILNCTIVQRWMTLDQMIQNRPWIINALQNQFCVQAPCLLGRVLSANQLMMQHSQSHSCLRGPRLKDCCKTTPHCNYCPHSVCYTRTKCSPDRKQCHQFPSPYTCVANCQPLPQIRSTSQVKVAPEPVYQLPTTVLPAPQDPEQRLRDLLVTHNRKYFEEIGKICCSKKPRKQNLDLLATIPDRTIYRRDFNNKGEPDRLTVERWPDYKNNLPFQKNTQYISQFPEKPLPAKIVKEPPKGLEEKPSFGMSHYKHNYPKWGVPPKLNFMPKDVTTIIPGIPMEKDTVYKRQFDKKTVKPNVLKKQVHRPPFTGQDMPMTTNYRERYLPWKPEPTETMKPKEYPGKEVGPAKLHTEYKDNFIGEPDQLNRCHYKVIDGFNQVLNSDSFAQ